MMHDILDELFKQHCIYEAVNPEETFISEVITVCPIGALVVIGVLVEHNELVDKPPYEFTANLADFIGCLPSLIKEGLVHA